MESTSEHSLLIYTSGMRSTEESETAIRQKAIEDHPGWLRQRASHDDTIPAGIECAHTSVSRITDATVRCSKTKLNCCCNAMQVGKGSVREQVLIGGIFERRRFWRNTRWVSSNRLRRIQGTCHSRTFFFPHRSLNDVTLTFSQSVKSVNIRNGKSFARSTF